MQSDIPIYSQPIPEVADHPLFSGAHPVGLIASGAPLVAPSVPGGDAALRQMLKQQGLQYEETDGRYGQPEHSFIVHGPTREQMYAMGKQLGQESVVYSNGGKHELLYTNGPNDGKAHPAFPQYGFHPTQPPPDYYTKLPGRGYLRLHFDFDKLDQAPLQPQQPAQATPAQELVKTLRDSIGEPLEKRSKNVREQTRNITPVQALKRRIQYAQSIGLKPVSGHASNAQFPKAQQNRLGYGSDFPVEHETAHAMMTPPSQTIRQYQHWLNDTSKTPYSGDYHDDPEAFDEAVAHHEEGTFHENVANQLENKIDRRAGVSPQHASKYRRVVEPNTGSMPEHWLDEEATEKATLAAGRPGIRTPYQRAVTVPSEGIKDQADSYAQRFDEGARFAGTGRVQLPKGSDTVVNRGSGGTVGLRAFMDASKKRGL